jgi:hypothetical protein
MNEPYNPIVLLEGLRKTLGNSWGKPHSGLVYF